MAVGSGGVGEGKAFDREGDGVAESMPCAGSGSCGDSVACSFSGWAGGGGGGADSGGGGGGDRLGVRSAVG